MRLITFEQDGKTRLGAWIDQDRSILDLHRAVEHDGTSEIEPFDSMLALIEAGEPSWAKARALVTAPTPRAVIATSDVRLLAPLPVPTQIRDFLSFEQHFSNAMAAQAEVLIAQAEDPKAKRKELVDRGYGTIPRIWYEKPLYYTTSRFIVSSPDEDIYWPSYSRLMDYELELAVVIGKRGRDIPRQTARDHIFGYTIYNDWSARDMQARVMDGRLGPGRGKEFDQGVTLGPCIVTADEIEDPYALRMRAYVNGERWSDGSSSTMYHRFEACIADLSESQTLYPGEVLGSGTVGTGCGLEQNRFLADGDLVELEIEKIGVLRNRVFLS